MNKFFGGWLCSSGLTSLHQDYYGKAEYLRLVNEHWIDPNITVPLALIMIILGLSMAFGKSTQ